MQPWPHIKGDKKDIANYRPILAFKHRLWVKFILLILKNQMQKKTLVTIISEHQSEATKNKALPYTLSSICFTIDASNKLNKNLSVNSCFKLHVPISTLKLK